MLSGSFLREDALFLGVSLGPVVCFTRGRGPFFKDLLDDWEINQLNLHCVDWKAEVQTPDTGSSKDRHLQKQRILCVYIYVNAYTVQGH